jgi:hypothetical protein
MEKTMSIDDRIRKELEGRGADVERLEADEKSLFAMMLRVFTGGLRRWAAFAMVLTLAFVVLTVWTGYEFFVAGTADARIFWGVLAVAAFHAVSMFKFWFFMEMNRNSMLREIKRVEIELERLRSDVAD